MANNKKKAARPVTRLHSTGISGIARYLKGARPRLVVASLLAASVCAYLFGPGGFPHNDDIARNEPEKKCRPSVHWRAADNSGCSYARSDTEDAGISAFEHSGPNPETGTILSNPEPGPPVQAGADSSSRTRLGRDLVSGVTVAEICSTGGSTGQFVCRDAEFERIAGAPTNRGSEADESQGSISGFLMTSAGDGLAGIPVVAVPGRLFGEDRSAADTIRFWTATDEFGAYVFDGIPDGEYTIRSAHHGPYPSARTTARVGSAYANIVVTENLTAEAVGKVMSSEGWPLEGVTVLPALPGQPSVLTDRNGLFRLPVRLKSSVSSFDLRFQRPGYQEQMANVSLTHVQARDGIDLRVVMNPVEALTSVDGSVVSSAGAPLAGRTVEFRHLSSRQVHRTQTDSKGRFAFPVLEAPAEYRLVVFAGADHRDIEQLIHVSTDGEDLELIAEAYEFGSVSGRLINLDGEPVPDFELVFRNTHSRRPNAVVQTDASGNFEIDEAPAGDFVLASQATPSILVQGLVLGAGQNLHLPLVLDWGGHEIRGIVVDANDNPVPASKIVLNWSHEADGVNSRTIRRTASDAQGLFAFSNLGPGPHSLLIDAPGHPRVDLDHDLNRQGYNLTVKLN